MPATEKGKYVLRNYWVKGFFVGKFIYNQCQHKTSVNNQTRERLRLNATPSKRRLLNAAQAYAPDVAIAELIDNAIEVWREGTPSSDLEVTINLEFEDEICKRLILTDNGGGVAVERLEALVKPGIEGSDPTAIEVWGQGLKVAYIVLGQECVFRTRRRAGPVYRIEWDKEWWSRPEWELRAELDSDSDLPEGTFQVEIQDLKSPLRHEEVFGVEGPGSLTNKLGRIYAPLLGSPSGPRLHIILDDGKLPIPVIAHPIGGVDRAAEVFAFPPGFPPTIHREKLGRDGEVSAKAVVGLLPEQSRDLSGVWMYGNGRLFEQALKTGAVGFGTRGAAMIPASHPTTWRLLVLLFFEGPSEEIPWNAPTKDGYAANNRYFKEIRSFISSITAPYAAFTKAAKRLDVLPYSTKWNMLSEAEIRREITQFTRDAALVQAFLEANSQLSAAWKPEEAVDVAPLSSESTPSLPCLGVEASKAVAHSLQRRNRRDPFAPWRGSWAGRVKNDAPEQPIENETPADLEAAFLTTSQISEDWKPRQTIVRLPRAVLRMIESAAPDSLGSWLADAIEKRVAEEIDPIVQISPSEFRPVVQVVRQAILESIPDVLAIAVIGSVARGTADRRSDLDILVVHDERLRTQNKLADIFGDFRHPALHGPRYRIQCLVESAASLRLLGASNSKESQQMLTEAVWIHGKNARLEG